MSQESHSSAASSSAPVNSVTVDAVNFIMDNVWDAHKQHVGLRLGYDDCRKLSRPLKSNLQSTCPHSRSADAVKLFAELSHNNWVGEFQDIRDLTRRVVVAVMEKRDDGPRQRFSGLFKLANR
ncbi:MAG: hypothetical protein HYS17_00030 [Micavibrio aeruginosavorus]|uniref:Uncharacterized protein n=1 Tax=Micavibrio aeruginosavorus TaxID=349221 RepID=A0A7T5R277_9BACT|nr:MAG: hypothetical protein HYS17_00030 [Micavibrio aeruginosavorus]